jgi:hypothetical protein
MSRASVGGNSGSWFQTNLKDVGMPACECAKESHEFLLVGAKPPRYRFLCK